MNKFLNIVLKGMLTAFVIVIVGGLLSLNLKTPMNTSMVLVSSSLANSIKTTQNTKTEKNKNVVVEEVALKDEVVELKETEDKKEIKDDKKETKEVKKEEVKQVETQKEEPKKVEDTNSNQNNNNNNSNNNSNNNQTQTIIETPKGSYSPNTETTSGASNNTFTGYVTAYGPDCYGCYGSMTASGDYVGEGNIYYNHPTYGTIRIVAGDRSILNKVVRISGLNISSEPVIAIVRATGGDIGFNKPKGIVLDLLYTSEKSSEVLNFGKQWATVEVLN